MAANREDGIEDEVLDQLPKGPDPATVFETGGLVDELKKPSGYLMGSWITI